MWLGAQEKVPLVIAKTVQVTAAHRPERGAAARRCALRRAARRADHQGHQGRHRRRHAARQPHGRVSARSRRRRAAHGRVRPRDHDAAALPVRLDVVTETAPQGALHHAGRRRRRRQVDAGRPPQGLDRGARPQVHRHARAGRCAGRRDGAQAAGRRSRSSVGTASPRRCCISRPAASICARRCWPAIKSGTWVVCDRFADSTMAYQGYGHGADRAMLGHALRHRGGRFPARPHADPRPAGRDRAEARGGAAGHRDALRDRCRRTSTNACARASSTSPKPIPSAAS